MEIQFDLKEEQKNTSEYSVQNTSIDEGFALVRIEHKGEEALWLKREIDRSLIQFYFGVDGQATFHFNQGNYKLPLMKDNYLLFYNPQRALPLEIEVAPGSKLVFLYLSVERLHQLFVSESEEIAFVNADNIDKKFYATEALNPSLALTANQLFSNPLKGISEELFTKAKALELLALFFNREEDADVEVCPFLNDEENVKRIRLAKRLLVERMSQPPTIAELSLEIGLNEYRLKEGFKNIYGKTVFQFLNDYRLDTALHLMENKKVKVNDAAYHIGYTNPSHFISAFKKKFGITPKKYLQAKGL